MVGAITPAQKLVVPGGTYTYDDQRPVAPDTVFDAASLTKVLPTSCSALKLLQDGKISLDDDIRHYIPEYKNAVTVWNLLTQTVYYEFGFPLSSLGHKTPAEIMDAIYETPIRISNSEYHYTNSSSILLGMIVEKVCGKDLATVGTELFFSPLGMNRTGFIPLSFAKPEEIAPTELAGGRPVHAVVHDESTRAFAPKAVGSAGLFTTVPDLMKFLEMLLNNGESAGGRLFTAETIRSMGQNQLEGGASTGLGWELNQPRYMGRFAERTFGKTGFTGCMLICNPKLKSGAIILSNHIYPKRRHDFEPINAFRRAVADLVLGSATS